MADPKWSPRPKCWVHQSDTRNWDLSENIHLGTGLTYPNVGPESQLKRKFMQGPKLGQLPDTSQLQFKISPYLVLSTGLGCASSASKVVIDRQFEMRWSKSHGNQSQPACRQDTPQRPKCSLCGRRRSSRISNLGPDDIVDQFICSRDDCGRFKDLLTQLSSPRPVVQINHYNSGPGEVADERSYLTSFSTGRANSQNGLSTSKGSPQLRAELPGHSSPGSRVELHGDSSLGDRIELAVEGIQLPTRVYGRPPSRRHIGLVTPPPPVNYAAKPKVRR